MTLGLSESLRVRADGIFTHHRPITPPVVPLVVQSGNYSTEHYVFFIILPDDALFIAEV